MHHISLSASTLILSASLLAGATASSAAPATKQPKVSIKCLAPGSSRPVACATMTRETMLSIQLERGAEAPRSLIVRSSGNARTVGLQPKWFLDQSLGTRVKLPASLCDGARSGQTLQFEIQMATSDLQNAQSVGHFRIRC